MSFDRDERNRRIRNLSYLLDFITSLRQRHAMTCLRQETLLALTRGESHENVEHSYSRLLNVIHTIHSLCFFYLARFSLR